MPPIRQPSSPVAALAWWRASTRGERRPVFEDDPQPGFYRRRLVRGGPWVAARIDLVQILDPETGELAEPERLTCIVGGDRRDAYREWTWIASNPVTREEHARLEAARLTDPRMAAVLAPMDICAAPPRPTARSF